MFELKNVNNLFSHHSKYQMTIIEYHCFH